MAPGALAAAFDHVVVGRGAAAYVLASCLSADPDVSVLVVDPAAGVGDPRGAAPPRADDGRRETGARLAGGPLEADHDAWAGTLGPQWAWPRMRPLYDELQSDAHLADAVRDRVRPWRAPARGSAWTAALRQAVGEAAITAPQACECLAIASAPHTGEGDAALQLLARLRPNLTHAGRLTVERVRVANGQATGLELQAESGLRFVAARHDVVLAAGALDNPCILQRSGIGPRRVLAPLGIGVVQELPVGSHLQAHVALPALFTMRAGSRDEALGTAFRQMLLRAGALLHGTRGSMPDRLVLRLCSGEDGQRPDVEVQLQASGRRTRDAHGHAREAVDVSICPLRPRSRGQVRITGPSARHVPDIDPAPLQDRHDLRIAEAGLRLVRHILRQPAMAALQVEDDEGDLLNGPVAGRTVSRWVGEPRLVDAAGTCRMGPGVDAVVGPGFQVHAIAGLRVADASVLPGIPSGSVDAPAAAIALEAARRIRSGAPLHPPSGMTHPFDVFRTAIPMW